METLVAVVLIALILTGLVNLFVVGKRYVILSRSRTMGIELGKTFLDPLQNQFVRQENWTAANNCLTNSPNGCPGAQVVGSVTFTPTWNNTGVDGTDLRRATVTINWTAD
ncbi:MAG: hypothetical protein A3K83_01225 [Omnitrophica WOR_2 bacterium RBG_13_44_8b]|nr:MAG: hypothetical protein A3K83_01225 [Omnitrophica WOR_2 bacterium RBG_13_44_8b]